MSLDASKPSDTGNVVADLAGHQRETRTAVNALESSIAGLGAVSTHTDLVLSTGTTEINIPDNLSAIPSETINISGDGASSVASMTGGSAGQVKIFIFDDTDVDFDNSATKANGTFFLNQPIVSASFGPAQYDILALVNIGGDGVSDNGYWQELYRSVSAR